MTDGCNYTIFALNSIRMIFFFLDELIRVLLWNEQANHCFLLLLRCDCMLSTAWTIQLISQQLWWLSFCAHQLIRIVMTWAGWMERGGNRGEAFQSVLVYTHTNTHTHSSPWKIRTAHYSLSLTHTWIRNTHFVTGNFAVAMEAIGMSPHSDNLKIMRWAWEPCE